MQQRSTYIRLVQSGRRIAAKIGEYVPSLQSECGLLPALRCPLDDGAFFPGLGDRITQAHQTLQPLFRRCVQHFHTAAPHLTALPISAWMAYYISSCPRDKVLLHAYAAVVLFSTAQMQAQSEARYGPEKQKILYHVALEGLVRNYWLDQAAVLETVCTAPVLEEVATTMYAWLAKQPLEQLAHWFLGDQVELEVHAALPIIEPVLRRHGYQLEAPLEEQH